MDLSKAYQMIQLHEERRHLTDVNDGIEEFIDVKRQAGCHNNETEKNRRDNP